MADAAELPEGIGNYSDKLVAPYFAAIAEWYAALHVGQVGGALQAIIDRHLGDPFFGIFLNPGHQISLDDWVNSPVWSGSTVELREENGDKVVYQLVMPEEADAAKGMISTSSPIGRAILNKEEGDEINVTTPSGSRNFELIKLTTIHEEA